MQAEASDGEIVQVSERRRGGMAGVVQVGGVLRSQNAPVGTEAPARTLRMRLYDLA